VLPPAIASLAISSEVYRYQLEIYLPFLLLLIPLAREQAAKKPLLLAVHWVSFLTGMAVTLVNTMWIVRTVCSGWRHC
jgi:hypothetical protein